MRKYPGANNPHFLFLNHLGVARYVPGHFTIFLFYNSVGDCILCRILFRYHTLKRNSNSTWSAFSGKANKHSNKIILNLIIVYSRNLTYSCNICLNYITQYKHIFRAKIPNSHQMLVPISLLIPLSCTITFDLFHNGKTQQRYLF